MKNIKGFAFIGNPIEVSARLPFSISEQLTFRMPSTSQRRQVKRFLKSLGGHLNNCEAFECAYKSIPDLKLSRDNIEVVTHHRRRLHSSNWRYYVVEFRDGTQSPDSGCKEVMLLRASSYLTKCSFRLNPVFAAGAIFSDLTADWEYFTSIAADGGEVNHLRTKDLVDLRHCYSMLLSLRETHPSIARSIMMFHDLPVRQGHKEITTLGLFSVLESLLTHNPRGEVDSISRQIRKKIVLIDKRLPKPIDYSCFEEASVETIWTKLYDLRSRIAHGDEIDFERSLAVLHDVYSVELFLKGVLRFLLRAAAEEPDLYVDLKAV